MPSKRGAENTVSGDRGSRDSETVVGVFELWRNTRSRRSACNFDVVAPGATSRGPAASLGGPLRISVGRTAIVAGVVPVAAPFMHIVAQIVEPESAGRVQTDRLRTALPTPGVIGKQLGRLISPRVK